MNDEQLLRYSRQIMLPQIDVAGQEAIIASRVLIIGLGGLGCPVALYLAAAGVGELVLADFDEVDVSNLQRQIAHGHDDLGALKVDSAAASIKQINPDAKVTCITERLEGDALLEQVDFATLVVDCSDNFTTRQAINRASVQTKTPLVSGAAIRLEGQVAVFDSRHEDSPCYHCLYSVDGDENLTCSENGVLAPLVGVIGSVQALEALKVLADFGRPLRGRLLMLDAFSMDWRTLRLRRDPECSVCGGSS
jgi:adenylyltransferase/sulfurtransferase